MEKQGEWKRIDSGGIGRRLQCECGFKAAGYTWKDVDEQKAKHEAAITSNDSQTKKT